MKVPLRLWSCLIALSALFVAIAETRAQVAGEVFADPEG